MRVKRYVVDSMPDALQKIRTDLGKDAVILNTKELRSGGFLGMFGKKQIEVIAAIDSAVSISGGGSASSVTVQSVRSGVSSEEQIAASASIVPTAQSTAMPTAQRSVVMERTVALDVQSKDEIVLEEIRQMKAMVHNFTSGQDKRLLLPSFQVWEQQLLSQEIIPEIVEQVIQCAIDSAEQAKSSMSELTQQAARQFVVDELRKRLSTVRENKFFANTQVVHFVGPTGVGKTTTIAKLAAEQVLKHRRKVGFITSDTYRIAAVEQLRTYATILNIPLEVVFSPQDLSKAFQRLEDCDLIFMDTAGRNYRNELYVSELNSLLKSKGQSETFLVLSLTMKYNDMRLITSNFSKFKLDKVLFTKMDETDTYGAIVNLIEEFSLNLSYITNGQNVPDDIMEVNVDTLVDHFLGAEKDE